MQVLKMRFSGVFGRPLQHFTISELQEIKSIIENPPYHICHKNKTFNKSLCIKS